MPRPNPTKEEVQAEMTKYPGLNRDAAIGNIMMRPVPAASPLPALDNSSAVISPGLENLSTKRANQKELQTKGDLLSDSVVNAQGLIMKQANDPKYWKDGKYVGVDQTPPVAPIIPVVPPTPVPITTPKVNPTITDPYAQQYLNQQPFADTQEGKDYYNNYSAAAQHAKDVAAGIFTEGETAQIVGAGVAEGAKYDVLINQAKGKAAAGKASNLVAAAKAGGLDSTAWAGIAAMVGAPAGVENFEGMGGILAKFASEYDLTITNLEIQKNSAITVAMNAKKEYIATGSEKALKVANDMFDKAKGIYDDQQTLLANKSSVLQSYNEHLAKTTQEAQEAASDDLSIWAKAGLSSDTIADQKKRDMEISLKIPYGTFDKFYSALVASAQAEATGDTLDFEKKVADLAGSLSLGQSVNIKMPDGSVETIKGIGDDALLSITEAKELGVPYGTTKESAAKMGKVPTGRTGTKTTDSVSNIQSEINNYALQKSAGQKIPEWAEEYLVPEFKDGVATKNYKAIDVSKGSVSEIASKKQSYEKEQQAEIQTQLTTPSVVAQLIIDDLKNGKSEADITVSAKTLGISDAVFAKALAAAKRIMNINK